MSTAPKLENSNPLFDKNLISAFVGGVTKTMQDMTNTVVTPGKAYIEKSAGMKADVAGYVKMSSPPLQGVLIIGYSSTSIFTLIENMLGEKYPNINKDVCDAVGEFTNMIYGSSKTTLNQLGYKMDMAIPIVIKKEDPDNDLVRGVSLVIPFHLANNSSFFVEISIAS
ncbi:MAG: chemotaxis protein CheX [Pseudobdellovibrionaceae bacterium]